jgi:S-(hydroxymethyl)glutathione dehydrogenase/alcohol dehydrogenase
MKTKAAVAYEWNKPLVIDELQLDEPQAGEVLVQFKAAGICHSDLSVINGVVPLPPPLVAGHEGAGVVRQVGPGVSKVKPGDHIVMSWSPVCGVCYHCNKRQPYLCQLAASTNHGMMIDQSFRLKKGDQPINKMLGVGSFSEYNVVNQESVIRISEDIPFDIAAITGCAVSTGVGAVLRTAKVEPGSSVAVIGIGGVGINIIQGAALANATRIIAIDVMENKLKEATRFGATHTVNASQEDPLEAVKTITAGVGADYAFEALGKAETAKLAYGLIRAGGTAVIVGISQMEEILPVPLMDLVFGEKIVKASYYGSIDVRTDLNLFFELYKLGKLRLKEMITKRYRHAEINQGFSDLVSGKNMRGVIIYSE